MISAMAKEINLRQNELENKTLKSLYFGGGTPSLLKVDDLKFLIDEVLKHYTFDEDIEITLEANPDDLNQNFLKELSRTEFNRLSIGTQSFYEPDLRMMNRAHNSEEAESSIKRAQDFGFENISIDLIYGSPTSSMKIWKQNLQKTLDLQVPHISSYALTVEPKTALHQWILSNKISKPNESEQNEEFYYMSGFLKENGFEHYEISNFAKPGFHSKHNSAYWQYHEYLGIGPSAHSYDGRTKRSWNVANNSKYIQEISSNKLPLETEILTEKEQFNEMVMIGLRTIWGVNYPKLKQKISEEQFQKAIISINQKLEDGFLIFENDFLKIPEKHWFLSDGIASDLFLL
jgi:oxygen-independent coproporphyrinogen-3 oxidase